MLKEIIVNKLGGKLIEKIKEILVEEGESRAKKIVSEKNKKQFLKKYRESLDENLLKSYGNESFYDDLCRVLLKNNNLDILLRRCHNRNLVENETNEKFLDLIMQEVEGNPYNKTLIKSVIIHIGESAFESFNQLSDPEHIALKNIIKYEQDKTRVSIAEIKENSNEILMGQRNILEKISSSDKISECPAFAIDITWGCKNVVKHFLGRKNDLELINKLLEKDKNKNEKTSLWIYSMGGMGKTQLCRKLYSILNLKYSYIGWISYQGNFKQSLVNSISSLDRTGNLEKDYREAIHYLNGLGKRLLIFIDNYDAKNDCIDDIEALQCHVIITSRNKNPDTFTGYELGFLAFRDCKTLFRKFYTLEDNMIMNEIIHKTGYLALAVELVAKTGQKLGLSLQEYYLKLEEKGFDIQTIVQSNWDNNGEKLNAALSRHFGIVFDLTSLKVDSEAMYILKNFSVLPYLGIGQDDIIGWLNLDKEENLLYDLVDSGWLQRTSDFEYMMHPVICYTVKKAASPQVEDCTNMIKALSQCIFLEAGSNYLHVFTYLPYAASVGEYFAQNKMKDKGNVLLLLYIRLAEIYRQNGEYQKAVDWGEKACSYLTIIEKGKEKGILGNLIYNIMSEICLDMRDCNEECRDWALRAIASDEENTTEIDDIRKSTSFHNLACAYIQLEDNKNALKSEKKAEALRVNNLPQNDVRILNVYRNLAMIYRRLKAISEAYCYQKMVIEGLEKIYKNDKYHPDFPVAYSIYSFILRDMGRIDEAIFFQRKATEIREKNNKNDPKLAINYNNLGSFYLDANILENAEIWQKKAINMDLKNRGENHPDLVVDYFNYAKILEALGRYSQALECLQISREIELKNDTNSLKRIDKKISDVRSKIEK